MEIPRYIVIKLEMVDKNTIKATEITDRCEVYEYEADEDESQRENMTYMEMMEKIRSKR